MILITILNIAIFQGIVMGIIVLKSPQFNSKANVYLACAIFSLSAVLFTYVLELTHVADTIPSIGILYNITYDFIFPVFLFMFFAHYVKHPIATSKHTLWLYLPFTLSVLCDIIGGLDNVVGLFKMPWVLDFGILFYEILEMFIILFFIPGVLLYCYKFIKTVDNHEERKWLTTLWIFSILLLFSFILAIIVFSLIDYDVTVTVQVLVLLASIMIHWTAYSGIFKFRLARDQAEIKALIEKRKKPFSESKDDIDTKGKPLTKENQYFIKLEELCKNQHIYKDSSLDRNKVAEMLGISSGYVSQIINTVTGNNFASYINQYRVEAVKEIILDSAFDNYSLLAIGLECGFSSKTTFHNAFKKVTGITPNAYRLKHK